jgi:hypothetical protein
MYSRKNIFMAGLGQKYRGKARFILGCKKEKYLTVYRTKICIICQKNVFLYLPKYMVF